MELKARNGGIRRYQNPDGTLTPAGKERYLRAVNANNTDEKNLQRIRKIRNNIIAKNDDLKERYGNNDNMTRKQAKRFINDADKLGIDTSALKKATDKRERYLKNNRKDIDRGYRVENGKTGCQVREEYGFEHSQRYC